MFRLELLQLLELPSEDREVGITISIDKMHLIKISMMMMMMTMMMIMMMMMMTMGVFRYVA